MTDDTTTPPVLVVQHEDGAGPGLVGERLRAAGLDVRTVHPWRGEPLPGSLDGWAGLLVLGGSANCEDDTAAPWLPRVRELIREAVTGPAPTPVLGICLGGQLMAHALGGRVVRRPQGPELGTLPLRRLPARRRRRGVRLRAGGRARRAVALGRDRDAAARGGAADRR